jgi:hypothetical protein
MSNTFSRDSDASRDSHALYERYRSTHETSSDVGILIKASLEQSLHFAICDQCEIAVLATVFSAERGRGDNNCSGVGKLILG